MIASSKLKQDSVEELSCLVQTAIANDQLDVPMLPLVASKVITLTQDPKSNAKGLANLIQGDLSLAANVMRTANSAAYTPTANLVSLQQAIARLGMKVIAEIAVCASVNSKTFSAPGFESEISALWKHALATALWSKEVARECRKNVECIFLCGLLHSIGKPASLQKIVDLRDSHGLSVNTAECLNLMEKYQQAIGVKVVSQWGMPRVVVEVLSHLTDQENGGEPHGGTEANEATALVVTGAAFATHMLTPGRMPAQNLFELESLETINLYPDQVQAVLDKYASIRTSMEMMRV